ncbi:hypothetical protein HDV63DRAFT_118019 [Trichoderma sp. SZMC 28014]
MSSAVLSPMSLLQLLLSMFLLLQDLRKELLWISHLLTHRRVRVLIPQHCRFYYTHQLKSPVSLCAFFVVKIQKKVDKINKMPSRCNLFPKFIYKDRVSRFLKGKKAGGSIHKFQQEAVSFCCQVSKICSDPFSPKTPSLIE